MTKQSSFKEFKPKSSELPQAPPLPFTVKADMRGYLARIGLLRPIVALALIAFLMTRNMELGLITGALVVITLVVVIFAMSRRKVLLTDTGLRLIGAFGRRKTIDYADIDAARVFINYNDTGFGIVPRIFIKQQGGAAALSLSLLYWSPSYIDQMLSIFRVNKVKTVYYADMAMNHAIEAQFPGTLAYYERHPYWLATFIVLGLVVAVTIFALLTM